MAEDVGREVLKRLRSVEGHVRGVAKMVENDAYCIDVVQQILATEKALERIRGLLLDRHLRTCVTTAIRGEDPAERERVIEEILNVTAARGRN
jgi:DNA-binding FrmR family transcriptional regulator